MTPGEIRAVLTEALSELAPEASPAALADHADLREELDLDSMDFLHFVGAIEARLRVSVPEADYREVSTLGGAVRYLAPRLPA